jgi:hypothetical protein
MNISMQIYQLLLIGDKTHRRIGEAVALGLTSWSSPDVVAWVAYQRALRALLPATDQTVLPEQPPYPAGT